MNTLDTVVIELSQATLNPQFLDVPITVKSSASIFSFDYAFHFNLTKLTYSATIASSQAPVSLSSVSFFSPQDLFLRSTNFAQQAIPNATSVHSIRFVLAAACTSISAADFSDLLAIINGTQCICKVSTLDFTKFIPSPQYTTSPKCVNTPIIFTNTSTLSVGSFTQSIWKFDGQIDPSIPNTVQQYTSAAQHTLQILLATSAGCTSTLNTTFSISPPPVASFTNNYFCQGDSVQLVNTSTINPGSSITNYYWFFFDGTSSALQNPTHQFTQHKTYNVLLKITDSNNCIDTARNLVFVLSTDLNQDGTADVNDYLLFAPYYDMVCD